MHTHTHTHTHTHKNASSERPFSLLQLVKSYLRATTGHRRLNQLMILSSYKENVGELNLKMSQGSLSTKARQEYHGLGRCKCFDPFLSNILIKI